MTIDANLLVELGLKSLVVAGAALLALRLFRHRSAAERSWIGHLGLVALVLLPAVTWLLPAWNPLPATIPAPAPAVAHWPGAPAIAAALPAAPGAADTAPTTLAWPSAGQLALWAYAIPALLLLAAMVVAVVRLGAMHRRANVLVNPSWQAALALAQRRMGFKHGTALLVSEELRSPVSWGVMRPIILLNEQTVGATGEAEAIIAHELAHVARLDWAKLLIARLACALFWFNPLVWRLARECHQLREEAADDAVLLSEVDGAEYASLLVNAARHDNRALLLAAHGVAPGKDSLKRRITRVLDADLARGPANAGWAALCLVALAAVAAPLAAFDPTAQSPAQPAARDGSKLVTQRSGDGFVTLRRFPDGHETLVSASRSWTPNAADAANDKASDSGRDSQIDAIIASKAVGLTPDYISAMRAAGFDGPVDQLTGARAVGVTPEFARQMRRYDPSVNLQGVIGAKATGISPAYLIQMGGIFPGLSLDDAVGLSAVGVTPGFATQMRGLFPRVTADQVQGMAAVGVTPQFVREMRQQGLDATSPDQAIQSRVLFHGAPPVPPVPPAVGAPRAPLAPSAAIEPFTGGVAVRNADGSSASVGAGGVSVRNADGSSAAIGRGGVVVRNRDGSTAVVARSGGTD